MGAIGHSQFIAPPIGLHLLRVILEKAWAAGHLLLRDLRDVPQLGLSTATRMLVADVSQRKPLSVWLRSITPETFAVRPAGYASTIGLRCAGTDRATLRQVLVKEEYRSASMLPGIRLIVDCGANVGLASYYLLHRYPESRVIAVEADAGNAALCRRNLAPFGGRALVLHAAVWSECRPLRIVPESRRLGDWGLQVEPVSAPLADVEGLTIPAILDRAGETGPVDLMKIDIEGAEVELFRENRTQWLDYTRNLAIELHGEAAARAFTDALRPYDYRSSESGELTVLADVARRVATLPQA